jgi:ABC-2 type transport system permease protein
MSTPATPVKTATPVDGATPGTRRAPRLGGFNRVLLSLELRRMLRNRRTVFFSLLFPAALYFAFAGSSGSDERVGHGNVAAYVMVSMALYGAALTTASAGSSVALERSVGWSRQLRLTPLHPLAYIATKAACALVLGALAVAVVNGAALLQGRADLPAGRWLACALLALLCSFVFAALGLFVGYVVPGENAMQLLGPGLALFAFLGNLFIPITEGTTLWHVASVTPMFGVAEISRAPLTGELPWYAVVNAVAWLVVFVAGAAWRMSKDTARG